MPRPRRFKRLARSLSRGAPYMVAYGVGAMLVGALSQNPRVVVLADLTFSTALIFVGCSIFATAVISLVETVLNRRAIHQMQLESLKHMEQFRAIIDTVPIGRFVLDGDPEDEPPTPVKQKIN